VGALADQLQQLFQGLVGGDLLEIVFLDRKSVV
jgi:hypothetical protein